MNRDFTGGSKHRTISGSIKELFRTATKVLTHGDQDDRPAPSRRRSGKTEGEFCRLARGLLRTVFRGRAAARGRYAALRDLLSAPATPAEPISIPPEFLYADPDWNVFDITNPLHDYGGRFENDGNFDVGFDTVNEYLSPGL